jgi:nucleoside 2-deoxyribosyltransferase
MAECLICSTTDVTFQEIAGVTVYSCPRCGNWGLAHLTAEITNSLQTKLGNWDDRSVHLRSRLSHIIRLQQRRDGGYVQMPMHGGLEDWRLEDPLPTPAEQLDNLIIAVGNHQPSPAEAARQSSDSLSAEIGATITRHSPKAGLVWILDQSKTKLLIEKRGEQPLLRLTIEGWYRHFELRRGRVESRRVLMAMKFNDPQLDLVVESAFRPAVKQAGFELRLLTDQQPAGLIDDQLRVALRTSRFILADLTHNSPGAYWESGFAEGLGRPVIYTCREKEWQDQRTHFDTNHLVTIIWNAERLTQAAQQLTATIRATLPNEATMTDGGKSV